MARSETGRYFEAEDVGLLGEVLALTPDLDWLAYALKLARGRGKFPIGDYAGFAPLFAGRDGFRFKNRFIPQEYTRNLPHQAIRRRCRGPHEVAVALGWTSFLLGRQSHRGRLHHTPSGSVRKPRVQPVGRHQRGDICDLLMTL